MHLRRPPPVLTAAAYGAIAVAVLLLVGTTVARWPFAFDRRLITALRTPGNLAEPIGPAGLLPFMRDVTTLGDGNVLTMAVLAVTGLLLVQRRGLSAALVVASTLSGSLLVSWAKLFTARARPDLVPHLVDVSSLSFPSGHAANSAIVYLTLAAVASQAVQRRRVRGYLLGCALLLVGMIGVSRVYLGVHWPSDVLAGWSFGTLWAWSWWWASATVRRELPPETDAASEGEA